MKNKFINFLLIGFIISLISGCNNNLNSSSTGNSFSSSSSSFNEVEYTMTISDFCEFIETQSYVLEANETNSAARTTTIIEQQAYAIKTEITSETLNMYEGPYVIINGTENITYKSTDTILGDDYEGFAPKSDTYTMFRGKYNNTYYEITDFGQGKDRDTANKYVIGDLIKEDELSYQASMQASYFVYYYLNSLFGAYLSPSYELVPIVNENNDLEYSVKYSLPEQDDYGFIYYNAELNFTITTDGYINGYSYKYKESARDYDETGALGEEYTLYSLEDTGSLTRGERNSALETLPIIPTDYWLQSYDVEIVATNYVDTEFPCRNDSVSVGFYIEARAVNVYPEKALDINLTIISSSNNDVISVDSNGIVRSLKGGNTELTIQNESGIEKKINVTTFEESIEELEIKVFATHLFVGESYGVYEFYSPENALDSLIWDTDNHEIATITVDENGWATINCHKIGTVTISATSVKNPNVTATTTVTITQVLDEDTLKELITKESWYNKETPTDVITFYEDGTGSVTFKDFITEETGTYTFEWIFTEYSETEGLLISITTLIGDYNFSVCVLSLDGTTLEVYFQMTDPEMWYFQYAGDFMQSTN